MDFVGVILAIFLAVGFIAFIIGLYLLFSMGIVWVLFSLASLFGAGQGLWSHYWLISIMLCIVLYVIDAIRSKEK